MRRWSSEETVRCSFCHKSQAAVERLIASPGESPRSYICNECIAVCESILEEERPEPTQMPARLPKPTEIKSFLDQYVIGQAASMSALLLAAGAPGKRFALPNSRILLHEPGMSGLSGQATDIDIHAREILRMREVINHLLAKHSGQALDRIQKDVGRDFIMDAEEAKAYGIVDEIIHQKRR